MSDWDVTLSASTTLSRFAEPEPDFQSSYFVRSFRAWFFVERGSPAIETQ